MRTRTVTNGYTERTFIPMRSRRAARDAERTTVVTLLRDGAQPEVRTIRGKREGRRIAVSFAREHGGKVMRAYDGYRVDARRSV